ncbi:MAG: hypothetical protein JNJ75_13645 [Cyclobacteriaceae bacterium]|nr:hypothetical protein [Cyclobacteriaceae bacterium]
MKNTLLILGLLCLYVPAFTQVQNAKILLTGMIKYEKQKDIDPSYDIRLAGGYFLGERSLVGFSAGFGESVPARLYYLSGYKSLGVFGRYYLSIGDGSKFYFFIQPAYTWLRRTIQDLNDVNWDSNIISISPGFSFYPTSWIGVEFSLSGLSYEFAEQSRNNTFLLDINPLNPTIGLTFLLGGHD